MVTAMSRPAQRTSRGWSAAAIALFVVAQLLTLSHTAEVQHVRCATHGGLIEAATIDVHATDAVRLVGARGGAGGDEHCELAASLHQSATLGRPPLGPLVNATIVHVALAPPEAVLLGTVYAFAPKTSPPDRWVSLT